MKRLAAALAALLLLAAPSYAAGSVTAAEYDSLHAGQSRARVENLIGAHGHRTSMVATDVRRVLTKSYPAADGGRVVLTFWGPLCACGPLQGPYQLHSKRSTS